jgi:colanic acid/amylovoran biosynthesis glycosyltransferase
MKESVLVIAHYHTEWLPPTMTWLHGQIQQLDKHCENHVLCERNYGSRRFPVRDIYSFESLPVYRQYLQRIVKKTGITSHLPFYETVCKAIGTDLLHAHFGHMGIAALPVAQTLKIPLITTFYGMDVNQLPKSSQQIRDGYKKLFEGVSRVLCEGTYMAHDLVKLGCPPEKVLVHRLGIDIQHIPYREPVCNRDEPVKILIAASFREKKGIPLALKAIAALMDEFRLEVTIIGDAGADDASVREKQLIMHVIAEQNLDNIVYMPGFSTHEELLRAADRHDIFLSPSIHAHDGDCEGGAPVTIIEMAAAGLVVVSSTHCDIPGVIRHGETGFLAKENDLDDLILNLREAIDCREEWPMYTRASRAHIEEHFDARKQAERLIRHYKEVLSEE